MENSLEQALSKYVQNEKTREIIIKQIKEGFSGDFTKFAGSGADKDLMEYIGKMVRLHKTIKQIKKKIAENSMQGGGIPGDEEMKNAIMAKVKKIMGIDFAQYYQNFGASNTGSDELKAYISKMITLHKNIKKIKAQIGAQIEQRTA